MNEDGIHSEFKLLPPLSDQELATLSSNVPCPIPADILGVLKFARGFDGTWLGEVSFAGQPEAFGLDWIFPHLLELARDGLGNSWVMDLTEDSVSWGPIFFACHDAPVIVFQTDNLLHFVQEVIRDGNKPWQSEINDVWDSLSDVIWAENPGVLSFAHCVQSSDPEIRTFAESLDETWQIIDLRNPVLGDGFSWGRYGPKTVVKRFGSRRIFAYQKRSLVRRVLDAIQ